MPDFNYFSNIYDSILDSVFILNMETEEIIYGNSSFSELFKVSQNRIYNKKVSLSHLRLEEISTKKTIKNILSELSDLDSSQIVYLHNKDQERLVCQINCRKIHDKKLLLITIKDLTHEENLLSNFKNNIEQRDKKIFEMDKLIEILQKVRLLESHLKIIDEYLSFFKENREVDFIVIKNGNDTYFAKNNTSDKSDIETLEKFINENSTNKYSTKKIALAKNPNSYISIIPFQFNTKKITVLFGFKNEETCNFFNHQLAIILWDQLNTIINNYSLKELSSTDGLTKIKNSLFFRETLSGLSKNSKNCNLILFDVDHFKKINDSFGHPGGDEVLIKIAEGLKYIKSRYVNLGEKNCLFARVGGEEFAVLLTDTEESVGLDFAEQLRLYFQNTSVIYLEKEIKFTISLGISNCAYSPLLSEDKIKQFYKSADDCLYKSKNNGRNQIHKTNFNP